MLPCPWGRQQTGTLRLEYPRAQGSGIILACLTQVTQEQGVGPGLTFRTKFLP